MSTALRDSTVHRNVNKSPQPCIIKQDGETKKRHLDELKGVNVDEGVGLTSLSYKKMIFSTSRRSTSPSSASDAAAAAAGEDGSSSLEQSSTAGDESYERETDSSFDVFESGDSATLYPDSMSTWSTQHVNKPTPESVLAEIKEGGPMPIHQIKKADEHPDRLRGMEGKPSIIYFDTQATLQLAEDCRAHYCNYRFYPCAAKPCHAHAPPRLSSESDTETAKNQGQRVTIFDHERRRPEEQAPVGANRNSNSILDENEMGPCNPSNEQAQLDVLCPRPHPAPKVDLSRGSHLGSIILAPRLEDALALRAKLLQNHNQRMEQEMSMSNYGYVFDMVTSTGAAVTPPNGMPHKRIPKSA
jgi:hypothetical protein